MKFPKPENLYTASPANNSLLRNTVALICSRIVSGLAGFLARSVLIARFLGAPALGLYSFAYALANLGLIGADLGISKYGIQQIARREEKEKAPVYLGSMLLVKSILAILVYLLLTILSWILFGTETKFQIIQLVAAALLLDSVGNSFQSIFQAFEKMHYQAYTNIFIAIFNLLLVTLALLNKGDLILVCWIGLFSSMLRFLINLVLCCWRFCRPSFAYDPVFMKKLVSGGIHFALVVLFVSIYYRIDTVMLGFMQNDSVVGYYNAAYRLVEVPLLFSSSFAVSIFPQLSRLFAEDPEKMLHQSRVTIKLMSVLCLPIAILGAFLAPQIIHLIYGSEFDPAILSLTILIWSTIFIYPNTVAGNLVRAADLQKFSALITGLGAIFNILLNFILIPLYSAAGAAISTVATEMVVFVCHLLFLNQKKLNLLDAKKDLRLLLSGILVVICLYFLNKIHFENAYLSIAIFLISGLTLYTILLFVTKYISLDLLKNYFNLLKRKFS